jgi:hypothetical protein
MNTFFNNFGNPERNLLEFLAQSEDNDLRSQRSAKDDEHFKRRSTNVSATVTRRGIPTLLWLSLLLWLPWLSYLVCIPINFPREEFPASRATMCDNPPRWGHYPLRHPAYINVIDYIYLYLTSQAPFRTLNSGKSYALSVTRLSMRDYVPHSTLNISELRSWSFSVSVLPKGSREKSIFSYYKHIAATAQTEQICKM